MEEAPRCPGCGQSVFPFGQLVERDPVTLMLWHLDCAIEHRARGTDENEMTASLTPGCETCIVTIGSDGSVKHEERCTIEMYRAALADATARAEQERTFAAAQAENYEKARQLAITRGDDVERLSTTLDVLRGEHERLTGDFDAARAALREIVKQGEGDDVTTAHEMCRYCDWVIGWDGHRDDCAVAIAKRVLAVAPAKEEPHGS